MIALAGESSLRGAAVFNFVLTRRIGGGGFGEVWEAEHRLTGKLHAVKVLHGSSDPRIVEALKKEALVLHRLGEAWARARPGERSPFVEFVDIGEIEGRPTIVMELLKGRELRQVLEAEPGPWAEDRVVALVAAVLDALGFAHAERVVHRDIKPENLFLLEDGTIRILDFGIAKVQQTEGDKSTRVAGSVRYIAPERFDEVTTPRCDVYAMGLVAWELLAGAPACPSDAITGAFKWHTTVGIGDLCRARPEASPRLAAAISRLSAIEPDERPAEGFAAAKLVRDALTGRDGAVPPKIAIPPEKTETVRGGVGLAAGGLAGLGCLLVALLGGGVGLVAALVLLWPSATPSRVVQVERPTVIGVKAKAEPVIHDVGVLDDIQKTDDGGLLGEIAATGDAPLDESTGTGSVFGTQIGSGDLGVRGTGEGGGEAKGPEETRLSDPAAATTTATESIVMGEVDRAAIDEVVKRHMNQIRYCYQRELVKDAGLAGRITVKFTIAKDGTVSAAAIKASTMNNAAVEACVTGRFLRMVFPKPRGGGIAIVSYPFSFAPG